MPNSARKARKRSGEKFHHGEKIATGRYMPKADEQKARRNFRAKMNEAIKVAKEEAGRG